MKLDGAGADRDLAVLIADENGYFRTFVTLPEDVPAGAWELRAISLDGSSASHPFDAAAAAVVDASLGLRPAPKPAYRAAAATAAPTSW